MQIESKIYLEFNLMNVFKNFWKVIPMIKLKLKNEWKTLFAICLTFVYNRLLTLKGNTNLFKNLTHAIQQIRSRSKIFYFIIYMF